MAHRVKLVALGVAVGALCVGCSEGGASSQASPSPTDTAKDQPPPLRSLPGVKLEDDPFSDGEFGEAPKPIAEFIKGSQRAIVYLTGRRCGLLVTKQPKEGSLEKVLNLQTEKPTPKEASSNHLPYGPYTKISGTASDRSGAWASLSCSHRAVAIEYHSPVKRSLKKVSGSIAISEKSNHKEAFAAVGDKTARTALMSHKTFSRK